jgi:hypothetical protein
MQTLSESKPERTSLIKTHKLSAIYQFFCWCSGARLYILKQCPSEFNKYYGIGVIVFLTGLLASLSGGYAIYTVFRKLEISIPFGVLWGFLIFSVDWYIVSSLRKHQRKLNELGMALPRFILAILIAFVISMPLKMKLFEREIEQQILFDQQQSSLQYTNLLNNQFLDIEKIENENLSLRNEINKKQEQRDILFSMIVSEAEGTSPTRTPGKGPVYREKKSEYDKIDLELAQLRIQNNQQIQQNIQELNTLKERRDQVLSVAQVINEDSDGFLARLQALNTLNNKSLSIQIASWFIILLFITIESAPIIVKLLSTRGPYDDLLEAEEYIKQVEIRREVVQAELTEDHHIDLHSLLEKERNEMLYQIEKDHIHKEAEVLSEINKLKINKWKEEEISKLNAKSNTELHHNTSDLASADEVNKLFNLEPIPELKDMPYSDEDLMDEELESNASKENLIIDAEQNSPKG